MAANGTRARDALFAEYAKGFDRKLVSRRIGPEIECTAVCKETMREPTVRQVVAFFEGLARNPGWKEERDILVIDGRPQESCVGASVAIDGYNALVTTDVGTGTIEVCVPPSGTLKEADRRIRSIMGIVCSEAGRNGLDILGLGFSPVSEPSTSLVMPKPRYTYFTEKVFGDNIGRIALSSAAQCHVEVELEELPVALKVLNGASPALIALTANSTIVGRRQTGHLEFRGEAYKSLVDSGGIEPGRVGIPERFGTPERMFDTMLGFMPIFTKQHDGYYGYNGGSKSMGRYIDDGVAVVHSIPGNRERSIVPGLVDMLYLEGTVWWDARPKSGYGTVELRPCSFQLDTDDLMAINAVTLGLVENGTEAWERIGRYSESDVRAARGEAMSKGLRARIGGSSMEEFAGIVLESARQGLVAIGEDAAYLEPLYINLERMESPAERSRAHLAEMARRHADPEDAMRAFVEAHRYSV